MLLFTLRSALRNLFRQKLNSFIIIFSLSVSFALSNILITFISFESNTDRFHTKSDVTYRLFSDDPYEPGKELRFMHRDMREFLLNNYPEIVNICQINVVSRQGNKLAGNDKITEPKLLLTSDATFFEFFDFELFEGNKTKAIVMDGIILQKELAQSIFGNGPYLNNLITITKGDEQILTRVTGVLQPLEENTQFDFDAIVSNNGISGGSLFVELSDETNPQHLAESLSANELAPSLVGPGKGSFELKPFLSTFYNQSNVQPFENHRSRELILICWGIVFLLIVTASFNFINLYIVGLLNRQNEIGIKKIFGAGKANLLLSIGAEVSLFVLISLLLSLILTHYLIPYFNVVLSTQITFSYFAYLRVISIVAGIILSLIFLITMYMSVFVWRMNPIGLINDKRSKKVKANKSMFTIQFFITVGLVIYSFGVISQIQYIKNKPLGFNRNLMQLKVDKEQGDQLAILKDELLTHTQIKHVAMSSGNPVSGNAIIRLDLGNGEFFQSFIIGGDADLVKTLDLDIMEGRNINPQAQDEILANETLVKSFDMKDPIGMIVPGMDSKIVGVVKDFNCRSLKQEIPPFLIGHQDQLHFLLIDVSNLPKPEMITLVSSVWKDVFPEKAFEYKFLDQELMARHKKDLSFFKMIVSFTIASLLISIFGLYGIATFTTARRTKEIGIRKVLGASFKSIIALIWKDYIKLIMISITLAIPAVHYLLEGWLQEFAYKIELKWWFYTIPGAIIMLLVLLTVSGQSIRAANTNPVESIINE